MWFTLFIGFGFATVPPALVLTPAEETTLDTGEMVVRGGQAGMVTAVVDLPASEAVVLEEVMNLRARVKEVSSIQGLTIYQRDNNVTGAQWRAGMLGIEQQFHVLYTSDFARGWITFRMDDRKKNELAAAAGSYQAYAVDGQTRLVYRCDATPDSGVPDWMREMVAGRAMRQQIEGITLRAQAR